MCHSYSAVLDATCTKSLQLAGTSKATPVELQIRNKEHLQKQLMYTNDTKHNNINAGIRHFSHMTNARQPVSGTNVYNSYHTP